VSGLRYHPDFIDAEPFNSIGSEGQESLRTLIAEHVKESGSGLGQAMLADWPARAAAFVRLTPRPQA
jgi:glutamate synthase (ferredoxin)